MAIPAGYTYHDGAYWYGVSAGAGPYVIGTDGIPILAAHGDQGPADTNYAYRDGGYWYQDGSGPYVRDVDGKFYQRV